MRTILHVHTKYNTLVQTAFKSDAGFVAALDKVLICMTVLFCCAVSTPHFSLLAVSEFVHCRKELLIFSFVSSCQKLFLLISML